MKFNTIEEAAILLQDYNPKEAEAVRKLKASHGDLLKALKQMVEIAAENVDEDAVLLETEADHDDHRIRLAAIKQARAAIAKATGVTA